MLVWCRRALNLAHKCLGRSSLIVSGAIALRNQCQCIIAYHVTDGDEFRVNGEELLVRHVAPTAMSFIDVGANHGQWSELFVSHCQNLKWGLLIDASKEAFRRLKDKYGLDQRLSLSNVGVSDRPGLMPFFEEQNGGGMSSLVQGWSHLPNVTEIEVTLTTIDDELARHGVQGIDMMKIDVEGFDLHALRGASQLLSDQRVGVVQFEYNSVWREVGSTLRAATRLLESFGYSVYLLQGDGLHRSYQKFADIFLAQTTSR